MTCCAAEAHWRVRCPHPTLAHHSSASCISINVTCSSVSGGGGGGGGGSGGGGGGGGGGVRGSFQGFGFHIAPRNAHGASDV